MLRSLGSISRLEVTPSHHQVAKMALKIQRHLEVPHHVHHPALQQGNQHWTGLRLSIVLEIQVTSTKDERVTPPPPHTWQAPIVEDMVQDGKSGLTEAVVTSPGKAFLFYGQWSLGEGLSLGEAWHAMFKLSGTISWVSKQAQLSAKPVSLWDGWQLIAHAITEGHIEPRGPCYLCSIPPASTPFNFCNQDSSPWLANLLEAAKWWEVPSLGPQPVYQEQGWAPQCSQDWGQGQWELWVAPPWSPLHLSDHGFKSDRSSASTSSSVASMSEGSEGSRHPYHVQWPHREPGGHVKINLPVCKDEDTKDAIMHLSWCHHAPKLVLGLNCVSSCWVPRLHPFPLYHPFLTRLPGGAGEEFGDRHHLGWHPDHTGWALQQCQGLGCFEPGTLSAMNGWKRDCVRLGSAPVETPPDSHSIIPRMFPSRPHSWAEAWPFLWWTP